MAGYRLGMGAGRGLADFGRMTQQRETVKVAYGHCGGRGWKFAHSRREVLVGVPGGSGPEVERVPCRWCAPSREVRAA